MKESGRKRIDELRLNRKNSDDKTEKSGIPKTVAARIPENANNRNFEKQKRREDCCGEAQPRELREISEGRVKLED